MEATEFLTDAEVRSIQEGVLLACLHGTDEDDLDTGGGTLRLVAAASAASGHADQLLDDAVASARRAGHSWAAVGSVLGISKQAAQQRFGTSREDPDPVQPEQRLIRRVTALNEMEILRQEQAEGWHLVGFGIGKILVEASDHPWEHERLTFASHALLRTMEADGWQVVGVWGWWTYLKRPVPSGAASTPR